MCDQRSEDLGGFIIQNWALMNKSKFMATFLNPLNLMWQYLSKFTGIITVMLFDIYVVSNNSYLVKL